MDLCRRRGVTPNESVTATIPCDDAGTCCDLRSAVAVTQEHAALVAESLSSGAGLLVEAVDLSGCHADDSVVELIAQAAESGVLPQLRAVRLRRNSALTQRAVWGLLSAARCHRLTAVAVDPIEGCEALLRKLAAQCDDNARAVAASPIQP